jgi:hypothetical protein
MKKIVFSLLLSMSFFLFAAGYTFSLEMASIVNFTNLDMYAKYFDSVSPAQIFNDVSRHFSNAHKNRTARNVKEIDLFWGKTREIEYIINESKNDMLDLIMYSPTYSLRAYIWVATNNEGYIILFINDGSLGDMKVFQYVLNNAQASAPAPAPQPRPSPAPQARRIYTRVTTDTSKLLYVNGKYETLRLRNAPSLSSTKIGSLDRGTNVEILEEGSYATITDDTTGRSISGRWVKVRGGGYEGWCFSGYLDPY